MASHLAHNARSRAAPSGSHACPINVDTAVQKERCKHHPRRGNQEPGTSSSHRYEGRLAHGPAVAPQPRLTAEKDTHAARSGTECTTAEPWYSVSRQPVDQIARARALLPLDV